MTDIKKVAGIWLPATEEHLLPFLEGAAKQNSKGEGSYQLSYPRCYAQPHAFKPTQPSAGRRWECWHVVYALRPCF